MGALLHTLLACHEGRSEPLPQACRGLKRFMVEIVRADGAVERSVATGGCSTLHASEGMDRAGLGGTVRVTQLPDHLAGEPL